MATFLSLISVKCKCLLKLSFTPSTFSSKGILRREMDFFFSKSLFGLCAMSWRGVKGTESTLFRHKNKQKLVCKTANTPSRQDPQTNRGGWCFRWEFLVVPNLATSLLKNTKKSIFCYKSFLKSSKCLSGNVQCFLGTRLCLNENY